MKKYLKLVKKAVGTVALLLLMPSVAFSGNGKAETISNIASNSVHKVSHSLAGAVQYSANVSYKWAAHPQSTSEVEPAWAKNDSAQSSYKWANAETVQDSDRELSTFAGRSSYTWGVQSFSDQAGYKWGFRSYADQAGYKWGFRSYADQAGYKWGFRSYADQAGY
ncbi:MAG: hypothetical protein RJQ10_11660, partial [Haliea sp.]